MGTLLLALNGCKSPDVRVTKLNEPASTASSSDKKLNLDTPPIGDAKPDITSTPVPLPNDSSLPDDRRLDGRDQDRGTFANQTVHFQYDHANVPPNEATKIDQVTAAFKTKGSDFDLLIEGHCDERGTEEYNRSLGERRALALREILIQSGVDAKRIFTRSFGKDQPAIVSHDEAAWSKNRRGEFT